MHPKLFRRIFPPQLGITLTHTLLLITALTNRIRSICFSLRTVHYATITTSLSSTGNGACTAEHFVW